jgi:hypothetical protein
MPCFNWAASLVGVVGVVTGLSSVPTIASISPWHEDSVNMELQHNIAAAK